MLLRVLSPGRGGNSNSVYSLIQQKHMEQGGSSSGYYHNSPRNAGGNLVLLCHSAAAVIWVFWGGGGHTVFHWQTHLTRGWDLKLKLMATESPAGERRSRR